MSDGIIEDGDTAAAAAAEAQILKDAGVKIYTVLLMNPSEGNYNEARDAMLQMIGNGGTFVSADDPADLDSIMNALSSVVTCP